MATKHYSDRRDWDAAVDQFKLRREYLQYGLVEAFNQLGEHVGTWFAQYCTPNGVDPYGVIDVEKV